LGETLGFALRLTEENKAEVTEKEEKEMRNKIGILFIATFVALALVGSSYAMWSDSIYMYGTVNTGNIGVEWSIEDYGDSEPPEKDDVSWVETNIDGNGDLQIIVYNAYPCIDYWVDFDVHGTGSVPAHVNDFIITYNPDPFQGTVTITPALGYGPISGYQFHSSDRWYGRINIHLAQTAVQNGIYYFTVRLDYRQWNGEGNEQPFVQPPKLFSWAAFTSVSMPGYSSGAKAQFPTTWARWNGGGLHVDDVTGMLLASWDETQFSSQIYNIDMDRSTVGDTVVWNVDISNIADQWATECMIIIGDATGSAPLFMLRWTQGDGYPTYQTYSGGWSTPSPTLPLGMIINTDYVQDAASVHFDFTIPISYL
jgi:hypothetical protein